MTKDAIKDDGKLQDSDVTYPENKDPVARYNVILDEAKKEEDGSWEVQRTVKQVVTFDNELWFIKEFAVKALDKNFQKASKTTHEAMANVLTEYNEDFFSKPKWNWNQYIMRTKDLDSVKVEEHHGIIEDVSNT
jgi:hypothetical protein